MARSGQMLSDLITQLIHMRGNALQIFLSPNRGGQLGKILTNLEVSTVQKMRKEHNFFLIVHGKYSINFCRPRSKTTEWQYKSLIHDLTEGARVDADIIIHQGKNMAEIGHSDVEAAMAVYADNLQQVLDATSQLSNKIILENSCQQGTEIGFTIDQLAKIYQMIKPEVRGRIGFCIDLCHIFVAGAVDLRDPEIVEAMFKEFDAKIGLDKLSVIHFNDSKIQFDGHNDSHQDLLVGWIGNPLLGGGDAGFRRVVEWAEKLSIPMILETPRDLLGTKEQIALVRSWSINSTGSTVSENYLAATEEIRSEFAVAAKKTAANKSKTGKKTTIESETIAVSAAMDKIVLPKPTLKLQQKLKLPTPKLKSRLQE